MRRTLLSALVLAACGAGSSLPTRSTPIADPIAMNEGTAASVEPAPPPAARPPEPAQPAQPATPDPAQVKADLLAAEMAAFEKAKPVFDKWCAKCHSKDGAKTSVAKREHFDMTKYPFGGHHAMEISGEIRETLGLTGKKPTMPADRKGAVKGADLDAIKAWADAFDAAHAGGAHEGHTGHGGGHKH
jgi:hypothetical protein